MLYPSDPNYWDWVNTIREDIKELESFTLPIEEIQVDDPGNINDITELRASIELNGQQVPAYVSRQDDQWWLRDGKHRYNSLMQLGISTILVKDITKLKIKHDF